MCFKTKRLQKFYKFILNYMHYGNRWRSNVFNISNDSDLSIELWKLQFVEYLTHWACAKSWFFQAIICNCLQIYYKHLTISSKSGTNYTMWYRNNRIVTHWLNNFKIVIIILYNVNCYQACIISVFSITIWYWGVFLRSHQSMLIHTKKINYWCEYK